MTIDQRMAALDLANTIRIRNASVKRQVAELSTPDGLRHVADLLDHPDGPAGTVQIGQLVNAVHRVGPYVSGPLFTRTGIYRLDRHVRDLTPRQREHLARLLRTKADAFRPAKVAA